MKCLSLLSIAFAALGLAYTANADTLPAPKGDIILTISGDLARQNNETSAVFDIEMLRDLPLVTFATTTQWTEGSAEFTGVSLRVLLDHVGATGGTIGAIALNDYKIEIPAQSLEDDVPIVAFLMDGEVMSPRDKGPLWIVYPYDTDNAYRTETIYSRSIWQLDRLTSAD